MKQKRAGRPDIEIEYIRQIIPLLEMGNTTTDIAYVLGKSRRTIKRWCKILRDNGYEFKTAPRGNQPKSY